MDQRSEREPAAHVPAHEHERAHVQARRLQARRERHRHLGQEQRQEVHVPQRGDQARLQVIYFIYIDITVSSKICKLSCIYSYPFFIP